MILGCLKNQEFIFIRILGALLTQLIKAYISYTNFSAPKEKDKKESLDQKG